ncbi:hypothetical protein [Aquicoccus porphyridii]|uniref:hypothetical protein n=1 Tax=Aquicoccus porphyridii TaxID=1852029 RepID=UPI00273DAC4C|nr:hypothetical protein [Aquicoccus porphyridii]
MLSAERKRQNEAEAWLIVNKDLRRPKFGGPELPFILFVALFIGANLGHGLPLWLSAGLAPIAIFVVSWFACLRSHDEFEKRLNDIHSQYLSGETQ